MGSPLKIISLDDDEDFNRLLKVLLKKQGFNPSPYSDAATFLKNLKTENPALCILDLNLSEQLGAGFQVLKAIRANLGYALPIVILSRRSNPEDITKAMELGADDFITKPLDDFQLVSKLNNLLKIEKDDAKKLPHSKVPAPKRECNIEFGQYVHQVSEFGITLKGKELVARGTFITIEGSLILDITGQEAFSAQVMKTTIDQESGYFHSFIEFDPNNNEMASKVRAWILRNSD